MLIGASCRTSSREIRVEAQSLLHSGTGRRLIRVAGEQVEDVVAATVSALDDQAEIGGQGTVVGGAGSLVVRVGSGHIVGELAGALLDLTLVVGLGVVLDFLGHGLHLVDGVQNTDK